jgi:hypothetical protein
MHSESKQNRTTTKPKLFDDINTRDDDIYAPPLILETKHPWITGEQNASHLTKGIKTANMMWHREIGQ